MITLCQKHKSFLLIMCQIKASSSRFSTRISLKESTATRLCFRFWKMGTSITTKLRSTFSMRRIGTTSAKFSTWTTTRQADLKKKNSARLLTSSSTLSVEKNQWSPSRIILTITLILLREKFMHLFF